MEWYEEEVQRVEQERNKLTYEPQSIFYGSSSIRLWNTLYEDFQMLAPINLGFGGSTLEACVYFFERIMESFKPSRFIIYAGDNDLGDGKKPDDVHSYFIQLCENIYECFGAVPVAYISIKPSPQRWNINNDIKYTNTLIKKTIDKHQHMLSFINIYDSMLDEHGLPVTKFYAEDGLHLSNEGYILWKHLVLTHISSNHYGSLIMAS